MEVLEKNLGVKSGRYSFAAVDDVKVVAVRERVDVSRVLRNSDVDAADIVCIYGQTSNGKVRQG